MNINEMNINEMNINEMNILIFILYINKCLYLPLPTIFLF